MAYDNPIPGFQTNNTINLRLWAAKPDREFDLEAFNTGDYVQVGLYTVARSPAPLMWQRPPQCRGHAVSAKAATRAAGALSREWHLDPAGWDHMPHQDALHRGAAAQSAAQMRPLPCSLRVGA